MLGLGWQGILWPSQVRALGLHFCRSALFFVHLSSRNLYQGNRNSLQNAITVSANNSSSCDTSPCDGILNEWWCSCQVLYCGSTLANNSSLNIFEWQIATFQLLDANVLPKNVLFCCDKKQTTPSPPVLSIAILLGCELPWFYWFYWVNFIFTGSSSVSNKNKAQYI